MHAQGEATCGETCRAIQRATSGSDALRLWSGWRKTRLRSAMRRGKTLHALRQANSCLPFSARRPSFREVDRSASPTSYRHVVQRHCPRTRPRETATIGRPRNSFICFGPRGLHTEVPSLCRNPTKGGSRRQGREDRLKSEATTLFPRTMKSRSPLGRVQSGTRVLQTA
jgi:hypothetical protein